MQRCLLGCRDCMCQTENFEELILYPYLQWLRNHNVRHQGLDSSNVRLQTRDVDLYHFAGQTRLRVSSDLTTTRSAAMFQGKKFFLLQRVPSRTSFIDLIKHHGGQYVTFEESADYVIADHLRKDAPPGSVSYKFIEEANKTGSLPDVENYRIGRAGAVTASASAPVSTARWSKSTRTKFTPQDDEILRQWITSHAGYAVRGNELYIELAENVCQEAYDGHSNTNK